MRMSYVLPLAVSLSLLLACTEKEEKANLPEKAPVQAAAPAATATAPAAQETPAAAEGQTPAAAAPAGDPEAQKLASTPKEEQMLLTVTGAVASEKRTALSFRVAGFISEIRLKAGSDCKKGDVLATLDSRDNKLALEIAESTEESAKVALNNAKSEFDREVELKNQNASTASAFDRLKTSYDNARVNLKMAELKVTQARQALGDTKLVAPYNCVISKQMKNVGESVKSGDAVYEVYDVSDIEVTFNVPERMAGKLKVGDTLDVRIPSSGFSGKLPIIRLVAVVDDKTRTFQVVTRPPQDDQRVVPGFYAEGIIR
jgi:RND family efflux transporter MFP subunit